jgi:TetR/AcrR family transcriptional repressor of nem operon
MGRKPNLEVPQLILEQAEHLVHLRGYHATSMDDIARACKMTKANLFHHFGSKEELILAVLDWKTELYRKRRVEPLCAQGDPIKAVDEMFQEAGKFYGGNGCKAGCFMANIASEMADMSEPFRLRVSRYFQEWAKGMADCLKRAQKCGLLEATLEPQAAAEAIVSLYEGAILLARTQRDPSIFRRVGRVARSILEQHQNHRRKHTMGPKTPCGC